MRTSFHSWSIIGLYIEISSHSQFCFCAKLKHLKTCLTALIAKHFPHISSWAFAAKAAIKEAQGLLHSDSGNMVIASQLSELRKQATFLSYAKSSSSNKRRSVNIWSKVTNAPDSYIPLFNEMLRRTLLLHSLALMEVVLLPLTRWQGSWFDSINSY